MDLLTVVNRILPKLGEHPVTSLEDRHGTVAMILAEVDTQIEDLTTRGWWFNEYSTTLPLTVDNKVLVPAGTLKFVPADYTQKAAVRGSKLFNADTSTFVWDKQIEGTITVKLPFNELPESAAQFVWYSALVAAYITDIGLGDDVRAWAGKSTEASTSMMSEHLEQKRYATVRTRRYHKIRNAMRG